MYCLEDNTATCQALRELDDLEWGSDSPSHIVPLARVRRAQGDGADSDNVLTVHKPYSEIDSNDPQHGSRETATLQHRQRTGYEVDTGITGRAWYEEEDDGGEEIPITSLRRPRRPEGLSPPADATNDDESVQNHCQRVDSSDDHRIKRSQPIMWPIDPKRSDDSSSESSSDVEEQPVHHHRRDANRARHHRGHGRYSHSRRRHRSSGHRHHHQRHRGHGSKGNDGLDGRCYARPQFHSSPRHDDSPANAVDDSVSSVVSEEIKVQPSTMGKLQQRYGTLYLGTCLLMVNDR